MRLSSLPMMLATALLGGGFLGAVFIAGPVGMVHFNATLGWPDMDWALARRRRRRSADGGYHSRR